MKPPAFRFLLASSVVSLVLVVACTGSTTTSSSAAPVPEGATTPCTSVESCPSFACSCSGATINSRLCVDNYCVDQTRTCAATCGTTAPTVDGGPHPVGPSDPDASTMTPAGLGDPCVPVSVSALRVRTGAVTSLIVAHQVTPPTPANGTVNVSKNTQGKPSHITYDADGYLNDYTDDFTYNAAGALTYFKHDADGYVKDYTEDFTYNSAGLITHFKYDGDGYVKDYTDDFTYNSAGLITYFKHDADGYVNDFTEDFTYNSAGLITHFKYDGDGYVNDLTEDFTYNSAGLLTHWKVDAEGSTNDSTIDVTYSSSGAQTNLSSNGPRASGAVIKACK